MASHGYPLGLALIQEQQGLSRASKEHQTLLPGFVAGKEIIRPDLKYCQWEEPWKTVDGLDSKQFVNIDSVRKPVLIEKQDASLCSRLSSFGVTEPCTGPDKLSQLLASAPHKVPNAQVDVAFLYDMMKLVAVHTDLSQQSATPLINTDGELYSEKLITDILGDLAHGSKLTIQPDGQVIFSGSELEMKDFISFVAEFYVSNNVNKWRTQSVLVPYFNRVDWAETQVRIEESPLLFKATKVAPLKSPEKARRKRSTKKRNAQGIARERDIYKRNYFHACESLLSLMMDKKRCGRTTILTLKKSGPELPELLTQFSASITGTGLAVLFSVVCKVALGRAPLCASKLISTGFGFGLVWLAWAVNRLRSTIIFICKNAGKPDLKEKEMLSRVNESLNQIFFRATTLMAMAMLRFA